ncbi:lytic transglycosylase domain-containing protein [Mucilaginibacter sp. PAMB04168]|uniref:lytic transglycosylase domain-containing protein n=1 Tax=Mucilaginibacter sp. PAMB04168 TaxID=3138567 RepID=UPI0031F71108
MKNSPVLFNFLEFKKSTNATPLNFADEELPLTNAKVNRKIRYSIWKHSHHVLKTDDLQTKAEKWFPVIEPILKIYGIPEDFKYIPLLESGFERQARSPRGAAGIWQFMPGTAREYGLKVGHGKDDRLNARKSTIAACKYLKELYAQFNSWTLAAAAYNAGSPRVQKAINRKNKGNYFYMRLNRETSMYVYKLVAMKEVIDKPVENGYGNMWANLKPAQVLSLN